MKTVITFGTSMCFMLGICAFYNAPARWAAAAGRRIVRRPEHRQKGQGTVYHQDDRMAIIAGLACVDGDFWRSLWSRKRSICAGTVRIFSDG